MVAQAMTHLDVSVQSWPRAKKLPVGRGNQLRPPAAYPCTGSPLSSQAGEPTARTGTAEFTCNTPALTHPQYNP